MTEKSVSGGWLHAILDPVRQAKRKLLRRSEGERILLQRFERVHGRRPNREHPETFTDKLFCRLVSLNHQPDPRYTQVSDKYEARAYVASRVGEQHLVTLHWHGTDPRAIPFDRLPVEYVIKTNHACGQVIVVRGAVDRAEVTNQLGVWLSRDFYWAAREGQYYRIKPRIMIEEYLRNADGSGPLDYRIWCFGGKPEVIQVDNRAHDINSFFDVRWNQLDLYYRERAARPPIPRPVNLERMLEVASRLSASFDFVRVDLYNIDGRICFGEMTLTPAAGGVRLRPEGWDRKLGEKWITSPPGPSP